MTWERSDDPCKVDELQGKDAVWGGVSRERRNPQICISGAAELLLIKGTESRVQVFIFFPYSEEPGRKLGG